MDWFLERKLKKLGRVADPDKEFVQRLGDFLVPERQTRPFWSIGRKMATIPSLAAILIAGTTGTYAYASESVLPGHPLYAVKQGLERVEEKATIKPQTKLMVEIKHLGRRLQEDKALLNRRKKLPQARIKDFQSKLQTLIDQAGKIPEKQRAALDREIATVASGFYTLKIDVENAGLDAKERRDIDSLLDSSDKYIESKIDSMDSKRKEAFKAVEESIKKKGTK